MEATTENLKATRWTDSFEHNKQSVKIFKTNVWTKGEAKRLVELLSRDFPNHKINFDLDDCDKILRVEGIYLLNESIQMIVTERGFMCDVIE